MEVVDAKTALEQRVDFVSGSRFPCVLCKMFAFLRLNIQLNVMI
jgi:hypothetical protein